MKFCQNLNLFDIIKNLQANCNSNYHLAYTLPIMVSSLIFNIPRFFELRTELKLSNFTYFNETLNDYDVEERFCPTLVPTDIRKNPTYSRDYVLIANSIALVFVPMLILVVLNSFIFRTIRDAASQRHFVAPTSRSLCHHDAPLHRCRLHHLPLHLVHHQHVRVHPGTYILFYTPSLLLLNNTILIISDKVRHVELKYQEMNNHTDPTSKLLSP